MLAMSVTISDHSAKKTETQGRPYQQAANVSIEPYVALPYVGG